MKNFEITNRSKYITQKDYAIFYPNIQLKFKTIEPEFFL